MCVDEDRTFHKKMFSVNVRVVEIFVKNLNVILSSFHNSSKNKVIHPNF